MRTEPTHLFLHALRTFHAGFIDGMDAQIDMYDSDPASARALRHQNLVASSRLRNSLGHSNPVDWQTIRRGPFTLLRG